MKDLSFQEAIRIVYQESGEVASLEDREITGYDQYGMYETKWFIEKLYGHKPLGQLMLVAENDNLMLIDAMHSFSIADLAIKKSKEFDVFFFIGLLGYQLLHPDHPGPECEAVVPCLWINVNIQDSLKKETWLPTEAEAVSFLKSRKMKPNIIINTVSELQAYWLFKKPFIVNSDATRDEISKLSDQFQNILIAEAQIKGWKIDNTSSILNRQRLPGTWNRALNPPAPINILEVQNL
mgnify:CR=1 FL=1